MYGNKKIGIVVPAHNEERFIATVIDRSPEYIDRIYVVDDCSKDRTGAIVARLEAVSGGKVCLLRHTQNGGVGKAITTGYKQCLKDDIDIAVVMGGDNQMDPAQLPRLLDPVIKGEASYAIGDRISSMKHMKGMSYWRRFGNWILRWLTRIAAGNLQICDPQNGYTAITREALLWLDLDHVYPRYGYCNDLLVKLSAIGARMAHVAMPAVYGSEKSQIKYWHYIPTVSWLLLKGFLWRIKIQYFHRKNAKHSILPAS
jgi:glycosyltransferase involved in cell wall biosynthesis